MLPFLAILIFTIYLTYGVSDRLAVWIALPFVSLAAIFVMSPQIDFWWYKRNPPDLAMPLQRFLDEHFIFYKKLSPESKRKFRSRVALYIMGNNFMRPPTPDGSAERGTVPEDLKAAVAAYAAQVTFGKKEFLTGKFENFVIYPHPFPTPQYPPLHTSEIFELDGVVLFDANVLMAGITHAPDFFSIGLYEMARVFRQISPSISAPNLEEKLWWDLEQISGLSRAKIEHTIGLQELDIFGVAAHHFFTFPDRFAKILPDLYTLLSNFFNQNPVHGTQPIVGY